MLIIDRLMTDYQLAEAVNTEAMALFASGDANTMIIPAWAAQRLIALAFIALSFAVPINVGERI